jgi:predicted RNA binding protein YcfA (HicA-like mRNA interferase family)
MSPRLRRLSSRELVSALRSLGFEVIATRGSHAKLRRTGPRGEQQGLTIPVHREVAPGTLPAIYRQVAKLIPERDLRRFFFHD